MLAPSSEILGRKPVFIVTLFVYTAVTIGCALAPNITCLLLCRLITGTAAASPLTNSGGVLTDIWTIDKLGIPMSCFSVAPFLGPVLGPILGGFEAQYANVGSSKNWQWVYYTCLIFGFVCFLMVVFLLPETYGPTILEKRVKKLRKENNDDRYYSSSMKNRPPIGELLKVSLTRPIRLQFTEPIIIFSSIYVSIVYGVLYISFEMFPLVCEHYLYDVTNLSRRYSKVSITCPSLCPDCHSFQSRLVLHFSWWSQSFSTSVSVR